MSRAPGSYAGLTGAQADLLSYIRMRENAGEEAPSFDEMMAAIGVVSKSAIHRLVSALQDRGYVTRLYHRSRSIRLTQPNANFLSGYSLAQLVHEIEARGFKVSAA